jgi:hypothetical protein
MEHNCEACDDFTPDQAALIEAIKRGVETNAMLAHLSGLAGEGI